MVEDSTKIYNGTIKATGTNNTELDFDARKVGNIYNEFDTLVKTINKYINSSGILGYAFSSINEKLKFATIRIVLHNLQDADSLRKPVLNLMKSVRSLVTAHDVKLNLEFIFPIDYTLYKRETVEWDV